MSLQIETTLFAPKEAEAITGVGTTQQRGFRRHGYLKQVEGHARFNGYDLATLLFVKAMSNCGIGPKVAFPNAAICANMIVHNAMRFDSVVSGDVDRLTDLGLVSSVGISLCEAAQKLDLLRKQFPDKAGLIESTPAEFIEKLETQKRREFAQRYITGALGSRVLAGNYFVLWADGTEYWTESLDDAFDDQTLMSDKLSKPAIVLSLESIAYDFARNLPKPLFSLNYSAPNETARRDDAPSPEKEANG